jgi:small subunit ribosomal protein S21
VLKVEIGRDESLERAMRRLKKKVEREGILKQLRIKKHYEKPSEKKKRKSREARRKTKYFY